MSSLLGPPPPTISGTIGGQTTTDETPIAPFAAVTIEDSAPETLDTLSISMSPGGQGTLSGEGLTSDNTLIGTASQITAELRSIIFSPLNSYPGSSFTTTLGLTARNSSPFAATNNQTSVTDTSTKPSLTINQNIIYEGGGVFAVSGQTFGSYNIEMLNLYAQINGFYFPVDSTVPDQNGNFTFAVRLGTQQPQTDSFIYVQAIASNDFGSSTQQASFSLTGGITGKRYTAEQDIYTTDGSEIVSSTYFRENGSRAVNVLGGEQTFDSSYDDVFLNHGAPASTFVFNPGFDQDVVRQFRVNGEDHDTLSLSGGDFHNSVAEVLRNTSNVGGAAVITDPATGDAIRLLGISKAQLAHNQADFSFHA